MKDQEFVRSTMDKICAIKDHMEKYGDGDIIAYYNVHRTYAGIDKYLKKRATARENEKIR